MITVSPFLTFAPSETAWRNNVPATGALISVPPVTTVVVAAGAAATGAAPAAPNVTL